MMTSRLLLPPDPAALLRSDPALREEAAAVASSFGEFARLWSFRDPDSGEVVSFGDGLWAGQAAMAEVLERHPKVFVLKSRKLGATTLETAYDAWVALTRPNARVHLFSRGDVAAIDLLDRVAFGLSKLPVWLAPPIGRRTTHVIEIGSGDDLRVVQAYAANAEGVAVEQSATHAHLDEWWRMISPERAMQAIAPTITGSAHILTTGMGASGMPADLWRRSVAGDSEWHPFFADFRQRPGRDEAWERRERATLTRLQFAHEFPETWQDALSAGGSRVFDPKDLATARESAWFGRSPAVQGHRYVTAWDIGGSGVSADASVGIVLDVSDREMVEVVELVRLVGVPYLTLQAEVEKLHVRYPGPTVIEANAAGEAVAANLRIPQPEIILWTTTSKSKPLIIAELQLAFEKRGLAYRASDFEQLDAELKDYQLEDEKLVQDTVVSLAIAYHHLSEGTRGRRQLGKLVGVFAWS